jgi:Ser/Thr protein kinase RdoA (MazF antagonist)
MNDAPTIDDVHLLAAQYPLPCPQVSLVSAAHHSVYRLVTAQARCVLRVVPVAVRPKLAREAAALTLLTPYVAVARVLPALSGASTSAVHAWAALCTHEVDGASVSLAQASPALMTRLGEYLGCWHSQRLRLGDPPGSETDALFGDKGYYPLIELLAKLSSPAAAVVRSAVERLRPLVNAPSPRILLHGDYLLHNIVVSSDEVTAVDLEYTRDGCALYDLAPLLWQVRTRPDHVALQQAFLQGYTAWQPLPEDDSPRLEAFVAARHIASLHWVAHNAGSTHFTGRASAVLEQRVRELAGYLATGFLRRAPA